MAKKPYPDDASDAEREFVALYLTLVCSDATQRDHDLREVFSALRWMVRSGSPWRSLTSDYPPWETVHEQTQRWIKAGVFEVLMHDVRELLRMAPGPKHVRCDDCRTLVDFVVQ